MSAIWLHRLSAHVSLPHLPLHHPSEPSRSTISLPISTDGDNSWDLAVPQELVKGTKLTKVSHKQQKELLVSIDPDEGKILYESRVSGVIPIEYIKEIRTGIEGAYYREQLSLPASYDERWITIIYIREAEYKMVHFVAPTVEMFRLWNGCLRRLHTVRQSLMRGLGNLAVRDQLWEKMYWKEADVSRDRKLDVVEMRKLCHRLGICVSEKEFEELFKQADVQNKGYFEYPEFQQFVKVMKRRPEIESIYNKLCEPAKGVFDLTVFLRFMRESQNSKLSDDELKVIFGRYTTASETAASSMTLDQFREFLLSDDNSPFSEQNKPVWQDMTRPLSEYYISSSHNTYLVGHQLVGVSTIEGYIRALLHSCRTVEMDVYDGPGGEPVVYHGKTFTSKVAVRDICNAVAKYAFVTSPYPVMISAEVHCGIKQQDKMVEIMRQIFGEALISAPADGTMLKFDKLPSPEDLKGKILLKAKNPSINKTLAELQAQRLVEAEAAFDAHDSDYTSDGTSEESSDGSSEDEGIIKSIFRRVRRKRDTLRHTPTAPQPALPNVGSERVEGSTTKPQTARKPKLSESLVSLLVYTVGVSCLGLGTAARVDYAPQYIFSLSENAANRIMKSQTFEDWSASSSPSAPAAPGNGPDEAGGKSGAKTGMRELIEHNQSHLTRIYPKGMRVNSSNYEPHRYWAAGAQIVAINWQTFDLGYTINQSMFQRNGKSGYVLKPAPLRRTDNEALLSKRTEHFLQMTRNSYPGL